MHRPLRVASPPASSRAGLNWVEVLVVLFVLGMLVMLAVPSVNSPRRASRELACKNNLKNLGLAIKNFEATQNHLPALVDDGSRSWPRQLLPYLDARTVYEKVEAGELDPSEVHQRVFACEHDRSSFQQPGGLSYAANAGYISHTVWGRENSLAHQTVTTDLYDWGTVEENTQVSWATGVFHYPAEGMKMSSDRITQGDGQKQTLLIAENLQSRNWGSRYFGDIAFGANVRISTFREHNTAPNYLAITDNTFPAFLANALPNAERESAGEGQAPRPSSNHPNGQINVLMADGRTITLNATIDPRVYYQMLTPLGSRYGQEKLDDNAF